MAAAASTRTLAAMLADKAGWDPEAALARVAAHPEEAAIGNESAGVLPVHHPRVFTDPRVLAAVLAAYPAGASAATHLGATALHFAVMQNAPAESIAMLLGAAPEAAATADWNNQLPVHLIKHSTPLEVVRALIRAHPAGLAQADTGKRLPLHHVVEHHPGDVVRAVVEAYPAALRVRYAYQNTLMERALADRDAGMVAWVLDAHMTQLLAAANERRGVRRSAGSRAAARAPQVQLQLRDEDRGAAAADVDAWITLVQHGGDAYASVVEAFLDAHAPYVTALAGATDSHGRKAIDLATPGVKRALLARMYLMGRYAVSWPPEHASATSIVYRGLDLLGDDGGDGASGADGADGAGEAKAGEGEAKAGEGEAKVAEREAADSGLDLFDDGSVGGGRVNNGLDLFGESDGGARGGADSGLDLFDEGPAGVIRRDVALDLFDEGGGSARGGAGAAPPPPAAHSKRAAPVLLDHPRPVVLKFVRTRAEFERERDARALLQRADAAAAAAAAPADAGGSLPPTRARAVDAVIPLLRCHDAAHDAEFARQVAAQPYDTHPHLLVMAAGERSLAAVIDAERAAPRWQAECVRATREVTEALAALHGAGVVHGDVKARNVMRASGGAYKLIDLDAAAPVGSDMGAKLSTAVAAPELLAARAVARARASRGNNAAVTAAAAASGGGGSGEDGEEDVEDEGLVPASPAVDMWGLGALLFHMLRGATLVHADAADNAVSPADEAAMAAWDDDARRTALAGIADAHARHLLAALLAPDPARRPSAAAVLSHPFLTGRAAARLPGDAPEHDVFISYRVASDAALARELHTRLSQAGLRVWLDVVCLVDGHRWLDGFCEGLAGSRVFVPLLSVGGIGSWAGLAPESPCDNVLLEHRLALELRARGLLDAVFPVFVGPPLPAATPGGGGGGAAAAGGSTDIVRGSLFDALRSGVMAPPADVVVATVEATLHAQLDGTLGLGVPLRDAASAAAVWKEMCAFQGAMLSGEHAPSMDAVVRRVAAAVASERVRKDKK